MAVLDENNKVINVVVFNDDEPDSPNQITYSEQNPAFIGGDYFEGNFYPPKSNCHDEEIRDEIYFSWTCSNPDHEIINVER